MPGRVTTASRAPSLLPSSLQWLAVLTFGPSLLITLTATGGLIVAAFNVNFFGGWILPLLVVVLFYLGAFIFFKQMGSRIDITTSKKITAAAVTALLWFPLSIIALLSQRPELIVPWSLALLACAIGATGPTARLVGVLLMIAGLLELLLSYDFFWILLLSILNGDSYYTRLILADVTPKGLVVISSEALLGAATLATGFFVALRRLSGRISGIAVCVAGVLWIWYSGELIQFRLSWIPYAINYSVMESGDFIRYQIVLLTLYLVCFMYLAMAGDDELVWREPSPVATQRTERPTALVDATIRDDAMWHLRLTASLRSTDIQRAPKYNVLRIFGTLVGSIALAITSIILGWSKVFTFTGYHSGLQQITQVGTMIFSVCIVGRGQSLLRRYLRQLRARNAEAEIESDPRRRPIFYLRSFSLELWDRPTVGELLFGPSPTYEEELVNVLRRSGPVIAIGRPDERLPRLGAARFYVSDDLWKQKVADVASVSQLVVWTTGVTEGLRWEIGHLLRSIPRKNLLLWAHPHLLGVSAARREAEWSRFRATLGDVFPKPLPEQLGEIRFIWFHADGEPCPVTARRSLWNWALRPWRSFHATALRSFLRTRSEPSLAR